ncbi:MAG TPA: SRPBCC family protein [Spirochaetota bacterium]|nr:SRPBCC family protein [Spirochaetota bacterium]HNT12537.1 SRPBCC family protein [Spirochaetota bacterium]HNV46490.1 SRPBCC family protein [Spirochaetota bacterium]HOS39796.1 SRPBCC family protein [Spirochaetota bacterium]HPU89742.1 SRPBCC family protein [Spirochaetota bacterium]
MENIYQSECQLRIKADPSTCYETLCDCSRFPDWFDCVRTVDVVDRHEDGKPRRVRYQFDAVLRQGFDVILSKQYDDANRTITFVMRDEDRREVSGYCTVEPGDRGGARATFYCRAALDFPFPPMVSSMFEERFAQAVLGYIRDAAEGRSCMAVAM